MAPKTPTIRVDSEVASMIGMLKGSSGTHSPLTTPLPDSDTEDMPAHARTAATTSAADAFAPARHATAPTTAPTTGAMTAPDDGGTTAARGPKGSAAMPGVLASARVTEGTGGELSLMRGLWAREVALVHHRRGVGALGCH